MSNSVVAVQGEGQYSLLLTLRFFSMKLAILISGTGRTLQNILQRIAEKTLDAEVVLVIASTPNAKGLQYAERANIPIRIIEKSDFPNQEQFSKSIFAACRECQVDYVVMAGYVKLLTIPDDFENRVLNIHPSLVPAFCGKGFYGISVHESVLQYGAKLSGCTVHFVNNHYDQGPVILQRAVPVLETDTPDTLSDRVFDMECIVYPEALQLLAEKRITVEGRRVRIRN